MSPRVSPTRLRLYGECRRKYWYKEVAKLSPEALGWDSPLDEPRWSGVGTYGHAVAAYALDDSQPTPDPTGLTADEVKCGNAAGAFLAELAGREGSPEGVESEFETRTPFGTYLARVDALFRSEGGGLVLVDHKLTGAMGFIEEHAAELEANIQSVLYAHAVFEAFPEAQELKAVWNYVSSKHKSSAGVRKKFITRTHTFFREPTKKAALEYCAAIPGMLALKNVTEPPEPAWAKDPCPDVCEAFGGCHYYRICHDTPEEEGDTMSLLDRLNSKSTATATAPEPRKAEPPPAPPAPATEQSSVVAPAAKTEPVVRVNPPPVVKHGNPAETGRVATPPPAPEPTQQEQLAECIRYCRSRGLDLAAYLIGKFDLDAD